MVSLTVFLVVALSLALPHHASGFAVRSRTSGKCVGQLSRWSNRNSRKPFCLLQATESPDETTSTTDEPEIVEATDEETPAAQSIMAPFMSQGEISDDIANSDLSDPKQLRVIIYIVISLVPVLFLVPLLIGSRDFIPPDALPPVEM